MDNLLNIKNLSVQFNTQNGVVRAVNRISFNIAKGETVAIREMRKHLAWYTRGMRGAARIREEINRATNRAQIDSILNHLLSY